MRSRRAVALLLVFLGAAGALGYFVFQQYGESWFGPAVADSKPKDDHAHEHAKSERVELTPQGFANLGPESRELVLDRFKRTIEVPGSVVDRPGLSDRGIPAPVAGIVTGIHAEPGVAVSPHELLFTLRISSEYFQNAQAELFKTSSEIDRNRRFRKRLAEEGVVPEAKLVELDQQFERLEVIALAHTQDLRSRGLTDPQLAEIKRGELIRHVQVLVPAALPGQKLLVSRSPSSPLVYEVQEIKVEVGQKVEAGQVLAFLANHHSLAIEGRAFAREAPLVEKAARENWPVAIEFLGDAPAPWEPRLESGRLLSYLNNLPSRTHTIRYVSNMFDPAKRLLLFQVPLINQGEPLERDGRTFLLWRYRPGQRVRLRVPVEVWQDVFVLPSSAVVREGPEAYVFRQDGDSFVRKPVRLLYEDRQHAVLDPEGSSIAPGQYIATRGAAVLNRILKSQAGEGEGHEHHHH